MLVSLFSGIAGNGWAYTWSGLDHVDWRYVNLQATAGTLWWPLSLTGVHLLHTANN